MTTRKLNRFYYQRGVFPSVVLILYYIINGIKEPYGIILFILIPIILGISAKYWGWPKTWAD